LCGPRTKTFGDPALNGNLSNGIFKDETGMHPCARKVRQKWSQVPCCHPITWKTKKVKTQWIPFLINNCNTNYVTLSLYYHYVTLPIHSHAEVNSHQVGYLRQ